MLRFLLSTSSKSERMANQTSGHFAYRIRSGLQARDLWSASLVYQFNITVLVVFGTVCYVWAAWLEVEINYWVTLAFSVLVLLAIEYVLITFTIEQIERGRMCLLVKLTSWNWATARNPWAVHIRLTVAFMLALGVGVLAIKTTDNLRENTICINPDGSANIIVTVDKSRTGLGSQTVLAFIRGANGEALYCVPVRIEGANWIVAVKDKNFADSSKTWKIDFYLKQLPYSIPEMTCYAKREDLRITDISYER